MFACQVKTHWVVCQINDFLRHLVVPTSSCGAYVILWCLRHPVVPTSSFGAYFIFWCLRHLVVPTSFYNILYIALLVFFWSLCFVHLEGLGYANGKWEAEVWLRDGWKMLLVCHMEFNVMKCGLEVEEMIKEFWKTFYSLDEFQEMFCMVEDLYFYLKANEGCCIQCLYISMFKKVCVGV